MSHDRKERFCMVVERGASLDDAAKRMRAAVADRRAVRDG